MHRSFREQHDVFGDLDGPLVGAGQQLPAGELKAVVGPQPAEVDRLGDEVEDVRLVAYAERIYNPRLNTWDEAKRQQNLKDHGIDLADLDGFFDGDLLTREDAREAYGEVRYQSIGVFNGVALFVAWTPRGEEGDISHLISVRKAESHEEQAWFQRYRKR